MILCDDEGYNYASSEECRDGAVDGSVALADVLSEGAKCSNGAVAGSVVSADVPSEGVECSDGGQQPPDRVVPSS